jgi:hypothetical protein
MTSINHQPPPVCDMIAPDPYHEDREALVAVSILAGAEYVPSALGLILGLKNLAMAIQEKSQSSRSRDCCYNPDTGSLHPPPAKS